jgi:hypothetical protein
MNRADNYRMEIGAVGGSIGNVLAQSGATGDGIQQAIGVAVAKQIQDVEKAQGQALIQMMQNAPTPNNNGLGEIINIRA